jgi:hypothetical protein
MNDCSVQPSFAATRIWENLQSQNPSIWIDPPGVHDGKIQTLGIFAIS